MRKGVLAVWLQQSDPSERISFSQGGCRRRDGAGVRASRGVGGAFGSEWL
jgi:hypothetical protein